LADESWNGRLAICTDQYNVFSNGSLRQWKDPEAKLGSARAFLNAASVMILLRRIARLT